MKRLSILLGVFALTLTMAVQAQAERGHRGMGKIMKQLDLSKEQKQQLQSLKENHKSSMQSLRDKKKALKNKLETAFSSQASDGELKAIHQELLNAKNEIGSKRFDKVLAIRAILTPEQRQKFDSIKSDFKKEHRGRRKGERKRGKED